MNNISPAWGGGTDSRWIKGKAVLTAGWSLAGWSYGTSSSDEPKEFLQFRPLGANG